MQNIFILNNDTTVYIQNDDGKIYTDTKENFIKDFEGIPRMKVNDALQKISEIDYNKDCEKCWLNNQPFQTFPNEYCERVLANLETIIGNKDARINVPETEEAKLERYRQIALDYQGDIYNKEKYAIAWVTRSDGTRIGFDTDLEDNSQVDWNSVRRVLDDMIAMGLFPEGTEPTIPYRYWKNETTKEYSNVTQSELIQAGIISSQQQNAAFQKFEPLLNRIRTADSLDILKYYLPPEVVAELEAEEGGETNE